MFHRLDFGLEPIEARLMDHNDLYVLDFGMKDIYLYIFATNNANFDNILSLAPSLKTLAIANVLEHKLNQDALPESIRFDIRAMTLPNSVTKPLNNAG